jgi:hypothetical protein
LGLVSLLMSSLLGFLEVAPSGMVAMIDLKRGMASSANLWRKTLWYVAKGGMP